MVKGIVGVVAPVFGVIVSTLQEVEAYLRIGALLAGIVVSMLTAISIAKNLRRKDSDKPKKHHK